MEPICLGEVAFETRMTQKRINQMKESLRIKREMSKQVEVGYTALNEFEIIVHKEDLEKALQLREDMGFNMGLKTAQNYLTSIGENSYSHDLSTLYKHENTTPLPPK